MKAMVRGEKVLLADITKAGQIEIMVEIQSGLSIDIACFGLDANRKLADDRYMVFYNQTASLGQEIRLTAGSSGQASFYIDLTTLPTAVPNLVFTAAIDGGGSMADIVGGTVTVKAAGSALLQYAFSGRDFAEEKAVILGEVYLRSGNWRVFAVGQGFNGGLQALLESFGGEAMEEGMAVRPPAPAKNSIKLEKRIQLEKKLEKQAPHILDLAKKATIRLEKSGMGEHTAKVALCLDISGSMLGLYSSGKIQALAERILALGTRFDDDGAIDVFLFGAKAHDIGELGVDNFSGFIHRALQDYPLEGGTYYGRVMKAIREHYFGQAGARSQKLSQPMPVYVMFVTDGATFDEDIAREQMHYSAYEPIFWQFMAIGKSGKDAKKKAGLLSGIFATATGSDFRFLEELDHMSGRFLDNANFFSVEDPAHIADEELYDLLLDEYPGWVRKAVEQGLING